MATEWAEPLSVWVRSHRNDTNFTSSCLWGLYSLVSALQFINVDCKCIHAYLSIDTVWVTRGGNWVLACFELLTDASGNSEVPDRQLTDNDGQLLETLYKAPERANREWGMVTAATRWALDSYSLGILIHEVFNGAITSAADVKAAATGSKAGAVPAKLQPFVQRCLSGNPRSRPQPSDILACDWFKQPLVGALLFLDELALKEPKDKAKFFTALPKLLPSFPDVICKYRILPALMSALEFGAAGGGGTVVLAPILDIGSRLPAAEYARDIIPCVVRLFGSNDRATRLQLLHHLPSFIESLSCTIVNGQVLTSIMTGFSDTNPVLREATVKAGLTLAPHLTSINLHTQLLKALKRCLTDPEPAVRVNACICLGRVAVHVDAGQREEELLASFLRSMRDPFPHARAAALRAVSHCLALPNPSQGRFFTSDAVARRAIPAAAFLCLDPVGDVRAAAMACMEAGIACLRVEGERLKGEEEAREKQAAADAVAAAAGGGASDGGGGAKPAAAAASVTSSGYGSMMVGALGWAVSGIASKIIVSGSIDDGAQPLAASGGSAVAPNQAEASSAPVQRSTSSGSISHDAAPAQAKPQPAVKLGATRLPAASSSPPRAAAGSQLVSKAVIADGDGDDGWGDDDGGWGDDDGKPAAGNARPAGAPASASKPAPGSVAPSSTSGGHSKIRPAAGSSGSVSATKTGLKAQIKDDDGWGDDGWGADAAQLPAKPPASRPVAKHNSTPVSDAGSNATDGGSTTTSDPPVSTKGKGMQLKGAATKIVQQAGPKEGDGWDAW